jgi:glycosyltransferase involved in cell wall biosynthesis
MTKGKGVLNVGVTVYSVPLRSTDEKKFVHLRDLADLYVVGFAEDVRYRRLHQPAELYLVPRLPFAAIRFLVLFVFALALGARLVWTRRIEIVLSQSPYEGLAGIVLRSLAGFAGRRLLVVTEVHGDWEEAPFLYRRIPFAAPLRALLRAWGGFVLRRSDAVRTISAFLERRVRDVAPRARLRRFPGYTDFELFQSERTGVSVDGNIIAVGALYSVKGFEHLVRAMKLVVSRWPNARLEIVGSGPLREKLALEARKAGVSDRVRLLGTLDQKELLERYHHAQVMVAPSLSEGLGRVVWEAMAACLPVVASGVGGIPDLVEDGKTGFLVRPGDESAIAERILFLLEHPDKAAEMGAAGRRAVQKIFSTERYVEGYRRLFDEVSAAS